MSAGKHVAVWPKVRVSVKGKSKIVARGDLVPDGVAQNDLDNLVSFGAIAGVSGGVTEAEAPAEDEGPKPGTADYILAEVGDDPAKAQTALDAEAEKGDKARKGLVEKLEALIAKGSS